MRALACDRQAPQTDHISKPIKDSRAQAAEECLKVRGK